MVRLMHGCMLMHARTHALVPSLPTLLFRATVPSSTRAPRTRVHSYTHTRMLLRACVHIGPRTHLRRHMCMRPPTVPHPRPIPFPPAPIAVRRHWRTRRHRRRHLST